MVAIEDLPQDMQDDIQRIGTSSLVGRAMSLGYKSSKQPSEKIWRSIITWHDGGPPPSRADLEADFANEIPSPGIRPWLPWIIATAVAVGGFIVGYWL
jgi:hypothetical protein